MTIGQRIRNSRIEQGVSQESLAELVDVSRQTVSKWENGAAYPSGENLTALSRIFHIPMDALVKDDWVPPEEKPPEVQYVEIPVEVKVEVPVPRPRNYRLWALLAAVVLTVGVFVGALFFRERHEESVPQTQLEGEVIDPSALGDLVSLAPLE
ncbi:MAG: helix-turn-helix transcriptional regulator [Lawsonibacter sp.]|jgi:transcriptional regulator with XRE-family HTH domain|nr:helix-turn-helix transcriptional regulator [Lawsonibacter sp.]